MHRDIKPPNIVICAPDLKLTAKDRPLAVAKISDMSNFEYKLADFNLACFCPSGIEKTNCGTPQFTSPEMLAGKSYSFGNDIW